MPSHQRWPLLSQVEPSSLAVESPYQVNGLDLQLVLAAIGLLQLHHHPLVSCLQFLYGLFLTSRYRRLVWVEQSQRLFSQAFDLHVFFLSSDLARQELLFWPSRLFTYLRLDPTKRRKQ